MKKRILTVVMVCMLCCTLTAAADTGIILPDVTEKDSVLYNNTYLGYSLRIPTWFYQVPEETNQQMLATFQSTEEDGDDHVYDVRYWLVKVTASDYLEFSIQLKSCTYDSFETEVSMAPEYANVMNAEFASKGIDGHCENIHDGILRDTPAGQMLETAYTYTNADGKVTNCVYYDFYCNTIEYCFSLQCSEISFEQMQKLLGQMMQTIHVENVIESV